jgi:Fe2+-dicitrate sensor, membrane component
MEYEPGKSMGEQDDVDCLLDRVRHRICLEENRKTVRLNPMQLVQRIAAILFLPVLLSFMIYVYLNKTGSDHHAWAEIMSPAGGRTHFVLPDGSSGFLNNGSVLKYPVDFAGNRKVSLTGEACFDIKHTGEPFHVQTQRLDVAVMGTVFNVSAYAGDQTEEVILKSGKVQVSTADGKELAVMDPGQLLTFGKSTQQFQLRNVDADQFTAWTEGTLIFRNEHLDKVIKRLGRWYNVDFEITDPELIGYTFHATFMDEHLDEALKLLSLTTPIVYEEVRKAAVPGEIQERRKIKLKLDKNKMKMYQ